MKLLLAAALSQASQLEAQLKTNSSISTELSCSDGLTKRPAFPNRNGGFSEGKCCVADDYDLIRGLYTYGFVHEKHGLEVLESPYRITDQFSGRRIHDRWSSYFNLGCFYRELYAAYLFQKFKKASNNHQRKWADQMYDLLMFAYQLSPDVKGNLSDEKLRTVCGLYAAIFTAAAGEKPTPIINGRGRPKKPTSWNRLDLPSRHKDYVLNFEYLEQSLLANNLADRDTRRWKTKLRVSGGFRTLEAARKYACTKLLYSTTRKLGLFVY